MGIVVCPPCGTPVVVPQGAGQERSSRLSWLVANKGWKPVDKTVVCPKCGPQPRSRRRPRSTVRS